MSLMEMGSFVGLEAEVASGLDLSQNPLGLNSNTGALELHKRLRLMPIVDLECSATRLV
jgi:hypothetical protein